MRQAVGGVAIANVNRGRLIGIRPIHRFFKVPSDPGGYILVVVVKLGVLLFYLLSAVGVAAAEDVRIAADTAYDRVRDGQLTLIDVRSVDEWRQSGIPSGALAISMHDRGGKAAFAKAVLQAVNGDRAKPIAVICAIGNRSRWAQNFLAEQGHSRVYDVSEGMFGRGKHLPGWLRRGLPVAPCPRC